ncbi:MAG: HlyC/CorC family transporter [Alphaproteobacteria bacterium]|nr:HlyC/CorC family transporter [Alphaproteobacteria bacterium]
MSDEDSQQGGFLRKLFHRKNNETVRETIEDLMEEAAENGESDFSQHEQLLLNNVLDLRGRRCENAMIARADIVAFPKDGTVMDLAELMIEQGHSRIPIYGESLDDIVGIVHVIDLVKGVLQNRNDVKITDIISDKIKFVSPEKGVMDLLKEMQQDKIHMAMVVDEYGGIDGLITIEDLLEEIVGDIEDEYDHEDEPVICNQNNGNVLADGKAELDEIKNICGVDLYDGLDEECAEDVDTLNSLIFHLIQRVPTRGEVINGVGGVKFRILEADPTQIKKAMIIRPKDNAVQNN